MTTTNVPHNSSHKNVIKNLIIHSLFSLITFSPILLTVWINYYQLSFNFPKTKINPEYQKVAELYYRSLFYY